MSNVSYSVAFVIVFFEYKQFSPTQLKIRFVSLSKLRMLVSNFINLTPSTKIMIKFHIQRFEFVLLQLWLILLTFLVCFASNQCPLTSLECDAMNALSTSLNLPTSITNYGNNQTNPCSKITKTNKNKKNTESNKDKTNHFIQFFFFS